MKKWNHYRCGTCGQTTIARHDQEGVTPFMIGCRAKPGCSGLAQSNFFSGPQNDDQIPHVIFYRPATLPEALDVIGNVRDRHERKWMLEHYNKGGAFMKDAPAPVPT